MTKHAAVLNHVATVVRPALRQYLAAERSLTEALASEDADSIATAHEDVIEATARNSLGRA
jgi:hypothetical protein